MKKTIFTIFIFILLLTHVSALDAAELHLKWTESSPNVTSVVRRDNNIFVFSDDGITKYYPNSTLKSEKYRINYLYNYYTENNYIYLFIHNEPKTDFKILDFNLNVIKSITLDAKEILHYDHIDNKYIIFSNYVKSDTVYSLDRFELNENLEIVKHQYREFSSIPYYYGSYNNVYYFQRGESSSTGNYYRYNGDFNTISRTLLPPEYVYDVFPNVVADLNAIGDYETIDSLGETTYNSILNKVTRTHDNTELFAKIIKEGNNYAAIVSEQGGNLNDLYIYYKKTILYLDSSLNEIWRVELPEQSSNYKFCHANTIRDNNVVDVKDGNVFIGSNDSVNQVAKIYNSNKQEINNLRSSVPNNIYRPIYSGYTNNGLFLVYTRFNPGCSASNNINNLSPIFPENSVNKNYVATPLVNFSADTYVLYFDTIYNVFTKVNGSGHLSVDKDQANYSDEVTFTATPDEGFALSEIIATDKNGNVLKFTDNKFTMPSADVTVEATFTKLNPETSADDIKNILASIVILLALLAIALITSQKNRLIKL